MADFNGAYQGLVWQCRYSDVEVPDRLWRVATFGAGKSYADDQAGDMIKETKSLKLFDTWVSDFVEHVRMNGIIPNIKEAERSARSTTNQDKI
jgi:hypothetical protein